MNTIEDFRVEQAIAKYKSTFGTSPYDPDFKRMRADLRRAFGYRRWLNSRKTDKQASLFSSGILTAPAPKETR